LTGFEGPVKVKGSMFLHPETPSSKGIQRMVEHPEEGCEANLLEGWSKHLKKGSHSKWATSLCFVMVSDGWFKLLISNLFSDAEYQATCATYWNAVCYGGYTDRQATN